MNPIPIWNTPIPSQICANPRLSVLNQGFWGCIKRREFKQMHPSHGQVRANIVQLNMAHIKLEPMISGFISPEHHPRNRNWLQPPWSSQVPFVKDVGISSDILLQNLQTNSTVSFRKAQPNRWVFFNSCTNEAPEPSPSWIACSWIDHIWDDPLNNYHPAQTLGNPQRIYDIYGGFSGISDGWLSIIWAEFFFLGLNGWTIGFLLRKPGEPWGTPCEISNMSFGDAGWQGASPKTPRTWYVPHDLMMGCSYGVKKNKGLWMFVNVVTCDPYGHGPYSCDQKRFFKGKSLHPSNLLNCWGCAVHLSQWQHGNLHCRLHRGRVRCPDPWWNVHRRLPVAVDCSFQTRRSNYPQRTLSKIKDTYEK